MTYTVRKHYNKIADAYGVFESYNPRKHILISKIFVHTLGTLRGLSVLDLGCGNGFFSRLAKKQGASFVLGIDISDEQIRLAMARAKKEKLAINYKRGNAFSIKFNKSFDVVIAGFTLSYAEKKSTLEKALRNVYKHLKPGGKLFAVVCNPQNPLRDKKIMYRVMSFKKGILTDGSKLRCEFYDPNGKLLCYDYKFFWSRHTFDTLLKKAGFTKIRWIEIKSRPGPVAVPKLRSTNIVLYAEKPTRV